MLGIMWGSLGFQRDAKMTCRPGLMAPRGVRAAPSEANSILVHVQSE